MLSHMMLVGVINIMLKKLNIIKIKLKHYLSSFICYKEFIKKWVINLEY